MSLNLQKCNIMVHNIIFRSITIYTCSTKMHFIKILQWLNRGHTLCHGNSHLQNLGTFLLLIMWGVKNLWILNFCVLQVFVYGWLTIAFILVFSLGQWCTVMAYQIPWLEHTDVNIWISKIVLSCRVFADYRGVGHVFYWASI